MSETQGEHDRTEVEGRRGLDGADGHTSDREFVQVAKHGFGDAYNGIAHSMSYFQDHVYVGTSRCNLQMISVNQNSPSTWVKPVKCPDNVYDLDRRAQIWSHDPQGEGWEKVYVSPSTVTDDGTTVPDDIGYRGQAVFQGRTDADATLYVCTWSPSKGRAPQLLRSVDGRNFERVGSLGSGDVRYNTFRTLVEFRGLLFTSPTGMTRGYGLATECMVDAPVVYQTPDPGTEAWQPASEPGFGDITNLTVFELRVFADHLYAGTLNAVKGFQIWKTAATGEPPYRWTKVLDAGAFRGKLNEIAISMWVFHGALYVGSGVQNGGRDRVHKIGPVGAELIRLHPDDSWDIVIGEERSTPDGLKSPLSGIGPGFDSFFNPIFWSMVDHDDELYLGTYNWAVFLPYLNQKNWPERFRQRVESIGVDTIVQRRAGFDLWRSRDGVEWTPVATDGFGNIFNYGIRRMLSTPHGLYVGTANTFGPEVAVKGPTGWEYVPNPASGAEVWVRPSRGSGTPAATGAARAATPALLRMRYDRRMYEPLIDEYYDHSGFYNWGYWEPGIESQKDASLNLIERLLRALPDKKGPILDVACGKGATTSSLLEYFPPSEIVAIDLSDKLMSTARARAPGCGLVVMDGTRLGFADASFAAVLSVDGAALFDTRADFLGEAYRVLVPTGRIILSDRLLTGLAVERIGGYHRDNYVEDLDDYRRLFDRAGFCQIDMEDATGPCLQGYIRNFAAFARTKRAADEIDDQTFKNIMRFLMSRMAVVRSYVLLSAVKPEGAQDPSLVHAGATETA